MLESEVDLGTSSDPQNVKATNNNMVVNKCGEEEEVVAAVEEDSGAKSPSSMIESCSQDVVALNGSVSPEVSDVSSATANGFQANSNNNNSENETDNEKSDAGESSNCNSSRSSSGVSSASGSTWTPQPFATPFIPQFLNVSVVNQAVGGPNVAGTMVQSPKRSSQQQQRFSPGPRDSRGGSPGINPPPLQSASPISSPLDPTVFSALNQAAAVGGPGQQHVVLLHVNPGETISLQMGAEMQLIQGPATVRMVSNSTTPPIPMPVQVPPGHMVQQIVDETGTLRHVILSAQPPMPVPLGRPAYGPGPPPPPNAPPSPTYYSYHPSPYTPHNQFHSRLPLGIPTAHLTPHPIHPHSGPPPPPPTAQHNHNHSCNNHQHQGPSPPPLHSLHNMDDRTQRQFQKIKRKYDAKQSRDLANHIINSRYSPPTSPKKENITSKEYKDRNTSTSGLEGTDDHHIQEDEAALIELLSSISEPQVSRITSKSALIKWQPPKMWLDSVTEGDKSSGEFDIKESEFSYELLLSERIRDGKYKVICSQEISEYNLTELKPATDYYVCVLALLDTLRGQPSESTLLRTLTCEPDTPTALKLVNRTKSTITLRWNAVSDNGSKLIAYILEYNERKEGDQFKEIYSGLQKQFKVAKLTASMRYRFRVAAVNDVGKSEYSTILTCFTSGGAPSQPLPPKLIEQSVRSLTLAWQIWASDDTAILQMDNPTTGHGFLTMYNGGENNYICNGLKRCQEYKFRLCVKNEEGSSPWSDVISYFTDPDRPSPPGRPSSKGRIHPYSFRSIWDSPKDNGGADISSYNLELDSGNGFVNVYNGQELEFNCDRLSPGRTYQLRVNCDGPGGRSDYSDVGVVVTAAVIPGQCNPPRLHGKAKAISLHIKWTSQAEDGGSVITEYAVEVTHPDGSNRIAYQGRDTDCVVAGLMPGRQYLFRVCASNSIGRGPWSDCLEAVSSAGPPDCPAELEVVSRSPHCVAVSWKEPCLNGASITEYRLEWSSKGSDFSLLYSGPGCSHELSKGLYPATVYGFRVQAVNAAGVGQYSEVVQITTLSSSPSSISSSSIRSTCSSNTITVSWQPPDCHGSEITAYNIDLGEKYGQIAIEGNKCEHLIEGLQSETAYRIRIQAVNSNGVGPYSSSVKVVTKGLPPTAPRLECVSTSHNSLKLKWGDGKNIDFTRYTLELETRSGVTVVYYGTALFYKVTKLSETTDYHFRIFGSNDAGDGPHSSVQVFTTARAPPPPLKAPTVSKITETSCSVEWTPLKSMGDDKINYQLQLLRGQREQEYKVIYRGEETNFNLAGLEPKTEYSLRVGGIRDCQTNVKGSGSSSGGSNSLIGPVGPSVTFSTYGLESNSSFEGKTSTLTTFRGTPKEPWTDQQWAVVFLFGFVVFGIAVAAIIQQIIAFGDPKV